MKKNIKLISLLVAAILLVGAVIGISVSAEEDTTPGIRIAGQNIAYEGAVQVLYLVETKNDAGYTPKLLISDKAFEVDGTIPEGVTVKECPTDAEGNPLTVQANGKTYFALFSNGIGPKNMRVAIYATPVLVAEDGSVVAGKQVVYSPWQYSINRFDKNPTEAQLALYTAMLDYAGAVQSALMTEDEVAAAGGYADAYYKYNKIYQASGVETLVGDSGWIRGIDYVPFVADKTYLDKIFYEFLVADVENAVGNTYSPVNLKPGTTSITAKYVGSQTVEYTTFDMEKTLAEYTTIKGSNNNITARPFTADVNGYYNIVSETTAGGATNQYLDTGRGTGGSEVYSCIPAFPRNYKRSNVDYVSYTVEFDFKVVDISKWLASGSDNWPIRIYVGATNASNDIAPLAIILYANVDADKNVTSLKYGTDTVITLTNDGTSNSSDWIHFAITVDPDTKTSTVQIGDQVFKDKTATKPASADFSGFDYVKVGVRGSASRYEYIRLGVDNLKSSATAINLRGEYAEEGSITCDADSQPSATVPGTDGRGYSETRLFGDDYAWAIGHDRNGASSAASRSASFADQGNEEKLIDPTWYASFDFMYCGGMYSEASPGGSFSFQLFFRSTKGELFNITAEPSADMESVVVGGVTLHKDVWYHILIESTSDYDQLITKKGVDMTVNGVKYSNVTINNGNLATNYNGTFDSFQVGTRAKAYSAHVAIDNVYVSSYGTVYQGGGGKYVADSLTFDGMETLTSGTNPIHSISAQSVLNENVDAKTYAKLTDLTDTEGAVNRVLEIGGNKGRSWATVTLGNYNKPAENAAGETHVFEADFMFTELTPGSFSSANYVYALKFNSGAKSGEFEIEFYLNTDGTLYPVINGATSVCNVYLEAGQWYNIRLEVVETPADEAAGTAAKIVSYLYVGDTLVRYRSGIASGNTDVTFENLTSEIRGGNSGTYVESFHCYWDNLYIGTKSAE